MKEKVRSKNWTAIITAFISIFIGILYLTIIAILDARGPLTPPPPEALVEVVAGVAHSSE